MSKAIRWTEEELAAFSRRTGAKKRAPLQAQANAAAGAALEVLAKPSKYRNTKVEQDGITHDSGKEAKRWDFLRQLEQAGTITHLRRQVSFELAPSVHLKGEARKKPALRYFADFVYRRAGVLVVEDTKSRPTRKLAAYRIKKHLMKTVLNLDITEI